MTNETQRAQTRRTQSRRTLLTVIVIAVLVLAALPAVATDRIIAGVIVAVILVVCLLVAWALTARGDRRAARDRATPLDQARAAIDIELVHAARAEHGESAGITEVRRQVPLLTYEQAVELHRYI